MRQQGDATDPNSISGIMSDANARVKNHPSIKNKSDTLNGEYLSNFTLGNNLISASIDISDPNLKGILERLELTLT